MLSINYAKKSGDGYIINLYADTAADLEAFDPTKPFGIYGIPKQGSVITLVSGTDAVNYYLNDVGTLVKIDVPVGPAPSTLTPFALGQTITGGIINVTADKSVIDEFLANATPEVYGTNSSMVETSRPVDRDGIQIMVANTFSGDDPMFDNYMLFVINGSYVYIYSTNEQTDKIGMSLTIPAGWSRLEMGTMEIISWSENVQLDLASPDEVTTYNNLFAPINGVYVGAIEGEGPQPGPEPSTLTPFDKNQTITGIDFGNVQNGDTNATMDAFLNNLDWEHAGEGGAAITLVQTTNGEALGCYNLSVLTEGTLNGYCVLCNFNVLYSTVAGQIPDGPSVTIGYQNLTSGKYAIAQDTVSSFDNTIQGWNGVFVGAVTE